MPAGLRTIATSYGVDAAQRAAGGHQTQETPGLWAGPGRRSGRGNAARPRRCGATTAFHFGAGTRDENYGDDGFDDDSDYDEPGAEPRRVRTPNRPVTPLPEPIIDRDFLDRDYDTPLYRGEVSAEEERACARE